MFTDSMWPTKRIKFCAIQTASFVRLGLPRVCTVQLCNHMRLPQSIMLNLFDPVEWNSTVAFYSEIVGVLHTALLLRKNVYIEIQIDLLYGAAVHLQNWNRRSFINQQFPGIALSAFRWVIFCTKCIESGYMKAFLVNSDLTWKNIMSWSFDLQNYNFDVLFIYLFQNCISMRLCAFIIREYI